MIQYIKGGPAKRRAGGEAIAVPGRPVGGAGPASLGHPTSRPQLGAFPEPSASGGRPSTGLGAAGQLKGFPWAFTTAAAAP